MQSSELLKPAQHFEFQFKKNPLVILSPPKKGRKGTPNSFGGGVTDAAGQEPICLCVYVSM